MTADPALAPLLAPLPIGSRTLRNRIVVTAHATRNVDAERLPNDDDIAYFAERARGGAAMVSMGTTAVHPSSPTPYGIYHNFDDRIVPRYEALSAAVHEHGALIVPQLGHMGARTDAGPGGVWAPSRVSHHNLGSYPHVMNEREITTVINAFAAAAERAVRGGMDGVEIAVGHGQLINLFLSPLTNTRTDGWGGSEENRFRFCREVLLAVREAIGDALLLVRVNGSDEVEGSLGVDAWLDIDQRIDEENLADAFNVSVGFGGSVIPTMTADHGCFLHYARGVRRRVRKPVGCVGRITDPALAARALADGDADFVGMTRAHIADPYVVAKIRDGRPESIRPCIGCLQMCQGELARNLNVKCVYNPVAGRERFRGRVERERAKRPRRVTVIGGGPAGLEAARVSALRGHEVTLLERSPTLGGALRIAQRTPGRAELGVAADWLAAEVHRLGVRVRTGEPATAASVAETAPDVVVLATGARSASPPWAAGAEDRVVGVREVVSGAARLSGSVLIVDDDHRSQGLAAAIVAARAGCEVTLVSDTPGLCELLEPEVRNDMLQSLRGLPFRVLISRKVRALRRRDQGVVVRLQEAFLEKLVYSAGSPGEITELEADWVVTTWAEPQDELFAELAASFDVRPVGDVLSPHRLEAAVHAAFDLAASI